MRGPCQWNLVASKPSLQLSGFFVKCLCSLCQNHPVKKSCLSNVQTGCTAISTLNWLQSSIRSHGYPQDSPKIAMLRWWRKGRGEKPRDRPGWWLGWAAGLMSNFRPNRAFGKSCRCSWNVVYFHTFSLKGQPFSGTLATLQGLGGPIRLWILDWRELRGRELQPFALCGLYHWFDGWNMMKYDEILMKYDELWWNSWRQTPLRPGTVVDDPVLCASGIPSFYLISQATCRCSSCCTVTALAAGTPGPRDAIKTYKDTHTYIIT